MSLIRTGTGYKRWLRVSVAHLPQLAEVKLERTRISELGMAGLLSNPGLKSIDIRGAAINVYGVARVKRMFPGVKILGAADVWKFWLSQLYIAPVWVVFRTPGIGGFLFELAVELTDRSTVYSYPVVP
jgi:hypothetical protein